MNNLFERLQEWYADFSRRRRSASLARQSTRMEAEERRADELAAAARDATSSEGAALKVLGNADQLATVCPDFDPGDYFDSHCRRIAVARIHNARIHIPQSGPAAQ